MDTLPYNNHVSFIIVWEYHNLRIAFGFFDSIDLVPFLYSKNNNEFSTYGK